MKWTFHITLFGTMDEVSVEDSSLDGALYKLADVIQQKLEIELAEISGETIAHQEQVIGCHYRPVISVMPKHREDRLRKSTRVSRAVQQAAQVLKG